MSKLEKNKAELARLFEEAKANGFMNDWYFATTFDRYKTQVQILSDLEEIIAEQPPVTMKEYGTGRKDLQTNPAINEFNKTSTAANGTVITLINILKSKMATGGRTGGKLEEFLADE